MKTSAVAALTAAFEETAIPAASGPEHGGEVIVTTWPTVPVEVVRSAGFRPVVVRGSSRATPRADQHLEPGIFPSRLRHLVEAALTGRMAGVARIVLPRTSEADYKCFLYLREFARLNVAPALVPTMLFDLLLSSGELAAAYAAARTSALLEDLAGCDRRPSDDEVRREIGRSNAARAAARRLTALRCGIPRVSGTEVFPLLGAFWQMPPERYAALANAAADDLGARAPLPGPRVLLTGAPVDTPALHEAIERRGAVVVAETGPWGSAGTMHDVAVDVAPMAALADAYRSHAIGPRTPLDPLRRWTEAQMDAVDAVVVSLPPEDTVFGWDYPATRDRLRARGIPHVCLRGDPAGGVAPAEQAQLDELVVAAVRVNGGRHG